MERQGRGGPVQARVEGRRREDAWDHHGPGLKREKSGGTPCGGWERITVNAANSSALSLWGEEFYRSLPPPSPPRALSSGPDSLNNEAQQSSPHGSLSCRIPRPADWPEDAIYDCIRLHKQATHNVLHTKEARSSILHVDHFPFNLFCLAEASGLIKERSLQIGAF